MKQIQLYFDCGWGESPRELLARYSRQTPWQTGRWRDIASEIELIGVDSPSDADFIVVLQSASLPAEILRQRPILYYQREPIDIEQPLEKEFFQSLGADLSVYGVYDFAPHAATWWIDKPFQELAALPIPQKLHSLSAIVSGKNRTSGHKERLAFVSTLATQLSADTFHIFGKGLEQVGLGDVYKGSLVAPNNCKFAGLAPYKYSLALENSQYDNYFTEKIVDCFLTWTKPLYWGAPNIGDYFPSESFAVIDIRDPLAYQAVLEELAKPVDYEALREARRRVLFGANIWAQVAADISSEIVLAGSSEGESELYSSQIGQDKILDKEVFQQKEGGLYIEVGATDGFHFSNTYFFERFRGWEGICIEPNPIEYRKLVASGRSCIPVQCAIADTEGTGQFLAIDGYGKGLSGLLEWYDSRHPERIERELEGRDSTRTIVEVRTVPLATILSEYGVKYVDYCSIDVEGAELAVLRSIDFNAVTIQCFSIENNYGSDEVRLFLEEKGYVLWKRLEWEDIYLLEKTSSVQNNITLSASEVYSELRADLHSYIQLPNEVAIKKWEQENLCELLPPERFDIPAKYMFARNFLTGNEHVWAEEVYRAHIVALNGAKEDDGSGKEGSKQFIEQFRHIIKDIARQGFSYRKAVPISREGILLDGAHRLAACLATQQPFYTYNTTVQGWKYPVEYFLQNGLEQKYADAIAREWVQLLPNARLVMLFPAAKQRRENAVELVEQELQQNGSIYYRREITLTSIHAAALLMKQIYRGEQWVGTSENGYPGAYDKAQKCFPFADDDTSLTMTVLLYVPKPETDVVALKQSLRTLFSIEKHSLHSTDTIEETKLLCNVCFHQGSINFLNNAKVVHYSRFAKLWQQYLQWHKEHKRKYPEIELCVSGSAVMSLLGLREGNDIDVVATGSIHSENHLISGHETEKGYYPLTFEEICQNPQNHFFYDGVQCVEPSVIAQMKERRGEAKDIRDRELLASVLKGDNMPKESKERKHSTKDEQCNKDPLVAVVIPCYNQAEYLPYAVASVAGQSYSNIHCIIVNDGSTDNTKETAILLQEKYKNVTIILVNKENGGLASARNAGIATTQAEYILPLDADDAIHPEYMSEAVALLQKTAADVVYCDEQNFGLSHHIHQKDPSVSLRKIASSNMFDYASLYKRSVWENVGGYSVAMFIGAEDWNFWVTAAKKGCRFVHLPKPYFQYRVRANSMVTETMDEFRYVQAQIVFHHKDLYSAAEQEYAKNILTHPSEKVQRKLEKAISQHRDNSILQEFYNIAHHVTSAEKSSNVPTVSVIMPTQGDKRLPFLREAILSVLQQTYKNIELILVNDGGTSIRFFAQEFGDTRLRLIEYSESGDRSVARNRGIEAARGTFIAYLDDDDIFLPEHIEKHLAALERHPEAMLTYSAAKKAIVSDDKYSQKGYKIEEKIYVPAHDYQRDELLIGNYIPICCVVHRAKLFEHIGTFDERLNAHEDHELWLRASRISIFVPIQEVTCEFREFTSGKHLPKERQLEYLQAHLYLYDKYSAIINNLSNVQKVQRQQLLYFYERYCNAAKIPFHPAGLENIRQEVRLPKIAIIIPVRNGWKFTKQCIENIILTQHHYCCEIIVIDNASTDETSKELQELRQIHPQIHVITNNTNESYSRANNKGAKQSDSDYYIFLNNDTKPLKGWLQALVREFEEHPETAIQGAKLLYENGRIQHAGMIFGERPGRPAEPYHAYLNAEATMPFVNKRRTVQFVTGACLAIRKNIFDTVGGFDENYVYGWEDTDLCMKVRTAGNTIIYNPHAVLYHYESVSKKLILEESSTTDYLSRLSPQEEQNRALFFSKWADNIILDDKEFYAQDGLELKGGKLYPLPLPKTTENQYKTSFSPEFWERNYNGITTVAMITTGALGDALMLTAVVYALKKRYPHLLITVFGDTLTQQVFFGNTEIAHFKNLQEFTPNDYQTVIDYRGIIGTLPEYYNGIGFMDILANIAGVALEQRALHYTITSEELKAAKALLGEKKGVIIGLHAHSSKDTARTWRNAAQYEKMLRNTNVDYCLIQFGNYDMLGGVSDEKCINCAVNKLSLRMQIALLSLCDIMISVDSAFFHVAHNLVSVPTLLLASITNPLLIGNKMQPFGIVRPKGHPALNSYWSVQHADSCLDSLQPATVLSAVEECIDYFGIQKKFSDKNRKNTASVVEWNADLRRKKQLISVTKDIHKELYNIFRERRAVQIVLVQSDEYQLPEYVYQWNDVVVIEKDAPESSIAVYAPFFTPSGYGDSARNLTFALAEQYPVRLRPLPPVVETFIEGMDNQEKEVVEKLLSTPVGKFEVSIYEFMGFRMKFIYDPIADYRIGRPIAETNIPQSWVEQCNKLDELWLANDFVAKLFRNAGVVVPMTIIPQGIDTNKYMPKGKKYAIKSRRNTVFLSVFEWIPRKGWKYLLQAWAKAFTAQDDVVLLIKTYKSDSFEKDVHEEIARDIQIYLQEIGCSNEQIAPIEIIATAITDAEMPELYRAANAFVLPTRAEGWGRPFMEAMATGLPTIATRYSGHLTFMNDANSLLIDVEHIEKIYDAKAVDTFIELAVPSVQHLAEILQKVYQQSPEVRAKATQARKDMATYWTWQHIAEKASARLAEISSTFIIHNENNTIKHQLHQENNIQPKKEQQMNFEQRKHAMPTDELVVTTSERIAAEAQQAGASTTIILNAPHLIAQEHLQDLEDAGLSHSARVQLALEYYESAQASKLMAQIARCIAPKGTLTLYYLSLPDIAGLYAQKQLSDPNLKALLKSSGVTTVYKSAFDEDDIRELLTQAGFEVIIVEPPLHLGNEVERCTGIVRARKISFQDIEETMQSRKITPVHVSAQQSVHATEKIVEKPFFNIIWEGSQFVWHSFALINREVTLKLIESGLANVAVIPYENDKEGVENSDKRFAKIAQHDIRNTPLDKAINMQLPTVWIRHQWPTQGEKPPFGKWVIIQPWEFGAFRQDMVEHFRKADEVWSPSTFSRQAFINSGIEFNKAQVVPNGINPERFTPSGIEYPLQTKKTFKFLFVGGTIYRKGIDILLNAYKKAFNANDNVCLVIKDIGGGSFYKGQTALEEIRSWQQNSQLPEIEYIDADLSEEGMAQLYRACSVFISPYRGEGFSLPTLEAMACGLPVIVTDGGATDDFVDEHVGMKLPAKRVPLGNTIDGKPLAAEGFVLETSVDDTANAMLAAFNNASEMFRAGVVASLRARTEWTWDRAAIAVLNRAIALTEQVHFSEIQTAIQQAFPPIVPDAVVLAGRAEEEWYAENIDEAIALWQQAFEQKNLPIKVAVLGMTRLASLAIAEGDFALCEELCQKAEQIMPDSPDTRYLRTVVFAIHEQWEQAVTELNSLMEQWKTLRFNSVMALTLDTIICDAARATFHLGEIEEALQVYELALKLNPENAQACFGAALSLYSLQEYKHALVMAEFAVSLEPAFQAAVHLVEELQQYQ